MSKLPELDNENEGGSQGKAEQTIFGLNLATIIVIIVGIVILPLLAFLMFTVLFAE